MAPAMKRSPQIQSNICGILLQVYDLKVQSSREAHPPNSFMIIAYKSRKVKKSPGAL
jgi:hypothetical protein